MAAFDEIHDKLFDRYKAASMRYQCRKAERDELAEKPTAGDEHDHAVEKAIIALQIAAMELNEARDAFLHGDW